jgi:hypothetical protein
MVLTVYNTSPYRLRVLCRERGVVINRERWV